MTLYDKLQKSMADRDVNSYANLIHEDAVFVFHKTGNEFSKSDWMSMATGMMTNEKFVQDSSRCVYENDDILVMHGIGYFPDGTKEAIMSVHSLSNGKIIKTESGATRID